MKAQWKDFVFLFKQVITCLKRLAVNRSMMLMVTTTVVASMAATF
jgi:hypothetical protein